MPEVSGSCTEKWQLYKTLPAVQGEFGLCGVLRRRPKTQQNPWRSIKKEMYMIASVLVSHGGFLKANGGELLGKLLDFALQLSDF